jgi:hypothetical protein
MLERLFDLIAKLRTLPFEKFWRLEEFWSAADEETYSVSTIKEKFPKA